MAAEELSRVLAAYPADCQPLECQALGGAGGFSGARLWKLNTRRGPLCLRRWPAEQRVERLEFIQAVLWHVDQEGFHPVPVPVEAKSHAGYVQAGGHFWELAPWMPGTADYQPLRRPVKLCVALTALAKFHRAAATFPLPDTGPAPSPGILDRTRRLGELLAGGKQSIADAVRPADWPELAKRAMLLLELFDAAAPRVARLLSAASGLRVDLQPCIRDVWHDHLLFQVDRVSGIVDFGAMRIENVAGDIARLLGSLAGDDAHAWGLGLAAYGGARRLSEAELQLTTTFDRSGTLMSGLQWLEWIYLQGRQFSDRSAVLQRLDEILKRLVHLAT